MATYDDGDGAYLRYRSLESGSVQLKIEEDKTQDSETNHATEVVGCRTAVRCRAIQGSGTLTAQGQAAPAEVRKTYSFGGQRVAVRVNGTLSYLYSDHLGSASLATNADGNVTAEMRYYPYGETRWSTGMLPTDRRFTEQREEVGLELYDYVARRYDPRLGRFLQADTIVPDPKAPQSLNRYMYCVGNPLRFSDPTGMFSEDEIMEYLGKENWEEVLALFEEGGEMAGYWGWLEVLRRAELGMPILFWANGSSVFEFSDIEGSFSDMNGHLVFNGFTRKTLTRWLTPGAMAGRLVEVAGVYGISNNMLGAGQKYYHCRYDTGKVDWVGASFDAAGIVADLLTLGVGGKLVNAKQVGDAIGPAADVLGLGWDLTSIAAIENQMSGVDATCLALDVAGMVSPYPFWADTVSLGLTLYQGLGRTP